MQSYYADRFEREMGCTVRELIERLPGAVDACALELLDDSAAVTLQGGGRLLLRWQALPPRRIGLISLPRLRARFVFERTDDATRYRFMRRFDLYMQRGGG
jgi:hypothetical protein